MQNRAKGGDRMNLNQKEYWDKVAFEKEFSTPFQSEVFIDNVDKNAKVLDIGCGYGRTLNELFISGYSNLYGVDFSNEMIKRGKLLNEKLNLITQENEKLPFEDNSFDAVILLAVLTCIPLDKDQNFLIDEIKRVLKKDGVLYINDFLLNTDERNLTRYNSFKEKYNKYGVFELPEGGVFRHHEEVYIKDIISSFENIVFQKVVYSTMNGNKSNGFYYLGRNDSK